MRPKPFYNQLKKSNELFNSTMQQDAQEFLSYLLNTLSDIIAKEEKDKRDAAAGGAQKPAPGKKDEPPPTFIQNLFEGRLTNETRCMCCETVTDRDEAFINLQIEIAQNSSVSSCLRCVLRPVGAVCTASRARLYRVERGDAHYTGTTCGSKRALLTCAGRAMLRGM